MPSVTALVDIGLQWPAGTAQDVTASRATLMVNAGWVEYTDTAPKKRRKASKTPDLVTENIADPATEPKE